jgi:hypothetical protein
MKRSKSLLLWGILLVAGMLLSQPGRAAFEVTGPDGRRIMLYDNGSWRYMEAKGAEQGGDKTKADGEAVLSLERKTERGNNCRYSLRLVNNLPYEIRNLVPFYSAYRANGVIHDTVASLSAFTALKPGDKQNREIDFAGIACQDIVRVQVSGGCRACRCKGRRIADGVGGRDCNFARAARDGSLPGVGRFGTPGRGAPTRTGWPTDSCELITSAR